MEVSCAGYVQLLYIIPSPPPHSNAHPHILHSHPLHILHPHTSHIAAIAADGISWTNLALGYELTGGLIRNAILSALSLVIKCGGGNQQLVIQEEHLARGAQLQLRCVWGCVCVGGGGVCASSGCV